MGMIPPKFFFELRIKRNIFISTRTLDWVTLYPISKIKHKQKIVKEKNLSFLMETIWDGRIRTSDLRDQNPLPYRLATPHLDLYSTLIKTNIGIGHSSIPTKIHIQYIVARIQHM